MINSIEEYPMNSRLYKLIVVDRDTVREEVVIDDYINKGTQINTRQYSILVIHLQTTLVREHSKMDPKCYYRSIYWEFQK